MANYSAAAARSYKFAGNWSVCRIDGISRIVSEHDVLQEDNLRPIYVGSDAPDNVHGAWLGHSQLIISEKESKAIDSADFGPHVVQLWTRCIDEITSLAFSGVVTPAAAKSAFRLIPKAVSVLYDARKGPPDVVVSGDGGVDLEWETSALFVSVRIEANGDSGFVFVEDCDGHRTQKLSEENLSVALRAF